LQLATGERKPMNLLLAAIHLVKRGWLDPKEVVSTNWSGVGGALEKAIKAFQAWHALPETGQPDPETTARLFAKTFCGHPDVMHVVSAAGGPPKRADPLSLTWYFKGPSLPTHTDAQVKAEIQAAFNAWSAHAPLAAKEAVSGEKPDCVIETGRIDGNFGTLAFMELPTIPNQQQGGKLDSQEKWDRPGGVPLGPVLKHELAHFLGLQHIPGNGTALMNPAISDITKPMPLDIAAIQNLYGLTPPVPPGPGPTPPPGPAKPFVITLAYDGAGNVVATGTGVVIKTGI
jgi:hypothetical protein